MDTDRLVVGEGTLNHFWTLCFADESQRHKLGLKYISQMWDQNPYWYVWFVDLPGVFKLSLLDCTAEVHGIGGRCSGSSITRVRRSQFFRGCQCWNKSAG